MSVYVFQLDTPCQTPAQFLHHANNIVSRHRYLRTCATSLYTTMLPVCALAFVNRTSLVSTTLDLFLCLHRQ